MEINGLQPSMNEGQLALPLSQYTLFLADEAGNKDSVTQWVMFLQNVAKKDDKEES